MLRRTILIVTAVVLLAGCSSPPPAPGSRWAIVWTRRSNTELILDRLPLEDYPALKKFHNLKEAHYRHDATDEKMVALARVGLTNLSCVAVNWGGARITDRGIQALSSIPSLYNLGLEETGITEAGMELLVTRLRLKGVNVANCPKLTAKGLMKLAQSETLDNLQFSSDNLTIEEAATIIRSTRNVRRCDIIDPTGKFRLKQSVLYSAARARNLRLLIRPKGAVQTRDEYFQRFEQRHKT